MFRKHWAGWIRMGSGVAWLGLLVLATGGVSTAGAGELAQDFVDPPASWKTRPLWFWNGPLSKARTDEILEKSAASGYSGLGILPSRGMEPGFMSPDYLARYGEALDKARSLGMKMCLYDEFWFPSGSAGGQLAREYPEALSKRLDMTIVDVEGPDSIRQPLPPGELMSAVAMSKRALQRFDITSRVKDGELSWDAPSGSWQVMIFTCATDGDKGLVDYLDPTAVEKFLRLTYEKYYAAFPRHFGTTIDIAFFDEPTMGWGEGCRVWTGQFNRKFKERYGYDPTTLYPALWFDIGPQTAAARNALFGFRAELYAEGFVGTVARWCKQHRILLTGHQDQEEVVNPVCLSGDLIKCFRHQDIPGVDEVFKYGRGSRAYKVVSSAATNYDRPLVMAECYGAMKDMPKAMLYKEAMDLFAKGINLMVPHAVWYDPEHVIFPPELSWRSPTYGPELPAYNKYVGRLQRMLQGGQHVVDVAVLYPIATMQAIQRFDRPEPRMGSLIPPGPHYMDVGEMLSLHVHSDFTYLHPDTLDQRCVVQQGQVHLRNSLSPQAYRVVILPNLSVIGTANMRAIKDFYDQGGDVVAITRIPDRSTELNGDATVRQFVTAVFGTTSLPQRSKPAAWNAPASPPLVHTNPRGGRAVLLPELTAEMLRGALDAALPVPDVRLGNSPRVKDGNFSYIHKVLDRRNIYFFANSSSTAVSTDVRLRGNFTLQQWDPHTGGIQSLPARTEGPATTARLELAPVSSVFWVSSTEP
jgi:hypothetical protein